MLARSLGEAAPPLPLGSGHIFLPLCLSTAALVHLTGQCTRPVNESRPQAGEGGFNRADSLHYEDRLLVRRDGCFSLPHTNHSLTTSPFPLFIPSPLGDRIIVEDIIFLRLLRCGHRFRTRVRELHFQRNSITVVHHEQCVTFN